VVTLVYLNQAFDKYQRHALAENRPIEVSELRQAVIEGALLRARPVIMTFDAITAGLLPIMLGSGTGSEVMRRIAALLVGGMLSATVLTLLVIPAASLVWHGRESRQ
jgi:Cu(I)/Ag(I) efflux system membrane protein CusA/SilA